MEKRSGIVMTDILTIKKTITPIARSYGVKRIYLLASYAKGNATENSDIDLFVEKGNPIESNNNYTSTALHYSTLHSQ